MPYAVTINASGATSYRAIAADVIAQLPQSETFGWVVRLPGA